MYTANKLKKIKCDALIKFCTRVRINLKYKTLSVKTISKDERTDFFFSCLTA